MSSCNRCCFHQLVLVTYFLPHIKRTTQYRKSLQSAKQVLLHVYIFSTVSVTKDARFLLFLCMKFCIAVSCYDLLPHSCPLKPTNRNVSLPTYLLVFLIQKVDNPFLSIRVYIIDTVLWSKLSLWPHLLLCQSIKWLKSHWLVQKRDRQRWRKKARKGKRCGTAWHYDWCVKLVEGIFWWGKQFECHF